MGSKSSKAAAEQATDDAAAPNVDEAPQTSQLHDENIEDVEIADEGSHKTSNLSPERAPISDIEMIIQSGLHEGEELPEDGPASKSLSGATASQHGLSVQQAVQELKEKFSINAPLESNGEDSLTQIRKEMDAYGVPLPIASAEPIASRKRSASTKSNGSSSSSDSGDETDASSSSSGSSLGFGAKRGIKRKANGDEVEEAEGSGDDSDEDEDSLSGKKGAKGKITMSEAAALFATPNEVLEPQIPAVAVHELPPTARLDLLGSIQSIIDTVIVVRATITELDSPDKGVNQILGEGSLVCTSDGKVVGPIFETFGAVTTPLYSLRLQTGSPFLSSLKAGDKVFFCPEPTFSSFLYTRDIQKQSAKASDASNLYDEEPNDGEVEFSDDEAEQEYKRLAKVERKNRRDRIAWEKEQAADDGDQGAAEAEFEFDEDDMEGDGDNEGQEAPEASKQQQDIAQKSARTDLEEGEERSEIASVRSQGSPRSKIRRLSQGSESRGSGAQRGREDARGAGRGRGARGTPRGRGGRQDSPFQKGGRGGDRDRGRGRGRGNSDSGRGGSSFDNRGRGRGRENHQSDRYRNRSPPRSSMDGLYQPVRHSLPTRPQFQHPDALPYDGPSQPPPIAAQPQQSASVALPSRPVSNLPQRAQTMGAPHGSHGHIASNGRPDPSMNAYNPNSHNQGQSARSEAYDPSSPSTNHFNGNMRATHGPLALLQNLQSNPFLNGMPFQMPMNPMAQHYSPMPMAQQQFRPPAPVQPRHFQPVQAALPARTEAAITPVTAKRNKTWVNPQSKAGQASASSQGASASSDAHQQASTPSTMYSPQSQYVPSHIQAPNAANGYNPGFGQNMSGQQSMPYNRQGGHYQPPSRSQNVNEYQVPTQRR